MHDSELVGVNREALFFDDPLNQSIQFVKPLRSRKREVIYKSGIGDAMRKCETLQPSIDPRHGEIR